MFDWVVDANAPSSHFHSDHYQGLGGSFDWGRIVCSPVTGNLVSRLLKVDEEYLMRIPLETWMCIDGVEVMLVDAFHCPGSVMFIFRLEGPRYILHTGDCRASKELLEFAIWEELAVPSFDAVYLDTTYCDPEYVFPSQSRAILHCCQVVDKLICERDQKLFVPIRRLVLVGSYLIGKEKIAVAIAKLLDSKIYCGARKMMVFGCLEWPELQMRLTDAPDEARVHIVAMSDVEPRTIGVMLDALWPRFTHALAIRPTGWTFGGPSSLGDSRGSLGRLKYHDHIRRDPHGQILKRKDAIAILPVPYSEHSSFSELVDLFESPWMKCDWVIPTVDNPLDLYLQRAHYQDPRSMLLAWDASCKQRKRQSPGAGGSTAPPC